MKGVLIVVATFLLAVGCTERDRGGGYPRAPVSEHTDVYHGVEVADPYRWMEVLDSTATRAWVEAQNELSRPYLDAIPARQAIVERLRELWNYPRGGTPRLRGGRYFFSRNDGLQDQSVIYAARSPAGEARVVIDPNEMSGDATVAVVDFVPSPDGAWLAYAVSDGGSDWKRWRVRDVRTREDLPETLGGTKFTTVSWSGDSAGFYYSRYPDGADGRPDDSRQVSVYFHRRGTAQRDDERVYTVDDHPRRDPYAEVSEDGRYLILALFDGFSANGLYYRRLDEPDAPVIRLFDAWDALYTYVGQRGSELIFQTNRGAPNGRVIGIDTARGDELREIVPESADALQDAHYVGGRVIAHYLHDVRSRVLVYNADGQLSSEIDLPGAGSVSALTGRPDVAEAFFIYADFVTPETLFRYDIASNRSEVVRRPDVPIEAGAYRTEQVFFESRDGTRVPMFITQRRDMRRDGRQPTLLYGYGGFSSAQLPDYQPSRMVWLEMGGVLAIANIRGGSEYGETWHTAGTKLDKQNVFDDFIAAAEWLIEHHYTSPDRLAIQGRSNGGLLVGAAMTQRPELFAAALPIVGVLDMLRYHTASANARQWSSDYGLSENAAEFQALYAYSPYHNVARGVCYPATLITTADRDDRVVPWHSYKFAAALQRAQSCDAPILIRIETRAGHKAGKPVWMQIEDFADQWAFLVDALAMKDATASLRRAGQGK